MQTRKSLFTHLAEAIDQYRTERQTVSVLHPATPNQTPGWRRALRWLTPNGGTLLLVALLILTQNVWANPQAATNAPGPSATTINYQGRLADKSGNPLTGTYGVEFAIYDAASSGSLIWGPESHSAVSVSGGLFSVGLGSKTTGGIPTNVWNGDRYLQITVNGEALTPRELIRSVPVAGMALVAQSALIAQSALVADSANLALDVPDRSIGSRKMAPTWYEAFSSQTYNTTALAPNYQSTGTSITFDCEVDCTIWVQHRGETMHSVTNGRIDIAIKLDGSIKLFELGIFVAINEPVEGSFFANLPAGNHTVSVFFACSVATPAGTCYYYGDSSGSWEHLYVLVFAQKP